MSENLVVKNIAVDRIAPNPYQPRKEFSKSALEELSASIKEYGVLQPINVRSIGDDFFELISGERRLRASKLAGLNEIPAVINAVVEHDSAIIALIENLQREDLNFIEEAEGYFNLINDHGLTQDELAQKVGKKQSTVANKLRILRLPQVVKVAILENGLTERHARALLKLQDEVLQIRALKTILKKQLNVKKTEEMIEKMLDEVAVELEPKSERKMRGKISYSIYVNTIKNTYRDIIKTGYKIDYNQIDKGEYIEITLKVPKNT